MPDDSSAGATCPCDEDVVPEEVVVWLDVVVLAVVALEELDCWVPLFESVEPDCWPFVKLTLNPIIIRINKQSFRFIIINLWDELN